MTYIVVEQGNGTLIEHGKFNDKTSAMDRLRECMSNDKKNQTSYFVRTVDDLNLATANA